MIEFVDTAGASPEARGLLDSADASKTRQLGLSSPAIPVALCFDVEPDKIEVDFEPRPWRGFEELVERVDALRSELSVASGGPVRINWFVRMDPQIRDSHGRTDWVADRYGDRLDALRAQGDCIGVHPHAWRWSPHRERWIADHADSDWIETCTRESFETYERVFGEPCRAWRFGDRFVSARSVRLGAELGAKFDLTVEPGMHAARSIRRRTLASGRIPSQVTAPRTPYRPSARDPLQAALSGEIPLADVWMIPLTPINSDPLVPLWRRVGRRIKRFRGPRYRTITLVASWRGEAFWRLLESDLDARPSPYLAMAVRSDAGIHPRYRSALEDKLVTLVKSPLASRLMFTTPAGIVAADKSRHVVSPPDGDA